MAGKFKKKKITIEIEISDISDISLILNDLNSEITQGNDSKFELTDKFNYKYKMEYMHKTEYIEKEIDGTYYQIIKSKKR